MCRKTHGHIGAYTATPKGALQLTEVARPEVVPIVGNRAPRLLRRMRRKLSSGSASSGSYVSIAAGTLDAPTGLKTTLQIHVDNAGDYYRDRPGDPPAAD